MDYNITHLTSAHPRYDTRIFIKECATLAKVENYRVHLVVADGLGYEQKEGVTIFDVGIIKGRLKRILKTTKKILIQALELKSDIYHIHDPELIPIGLKLKKEGKIVIFDAHEDVPKQIMAKHYLNAFSKKILSSLYAKYEIFALKKFDFVVGATPIIRDKFLSNGIQSQDINNFPILDEFIALEPKFDRDTICYIGLLYESRGIEQLVRAIEDLDITLIIAGKFYDIKYEEYIRSLKGWQKVDFRGFVERDEVKEILNSSLAGVVTLHPTPSYKEAYPVKMFEYMSASIAVISSDFTLYKELLGNSGICVDPLDITEIKEAIVTLCKNKKQTKLYGKNGRERILQHYNWDIEAQKLLELYKEKRAL